MPTRLSLRIQDCLQQLTTQERRLADLLLEREDDLLSYSAAELARLAGISKATATRFFRHLGYQDFNEVKLQAREERNRIAPDHRVRTEPPPLPPKGIDAYLRLELDNLLRTLEVIRADHLGEAAAIIAQARNVWVLGSAREQALARHVRLVLAGCRSHVRLLVEGGGLAEDLAMVAPRDAVLVLSTRPRSSSFDNVVSYLQTTHTSLIHVTDAASAAWARRRGGHVLVCRAASHALGVSYTSFVSTAQLLATVVAQRLGTHAQRRAQLIDEIHDEIEDLDA